MLKYSEFSPQVGKADDTKPVGSCGQIKALTFETFPEHSLIAGICFWWQAGKHKQQGLINMHTL